MLQWLSHSQTDARRDAARCAGARRDGPDDAQRLNHGRRGERPRSRGGRVGHRAKRRSSDAVHQDRRHRRRGRFMLPELPAANYNVWVRGYGLVDSTRSKGGPATPTLSSRQARKQPAGSREGVSRQLLALAAGAARANEFPGTGARGNGIPPELNARRSGSTASRATAISATSSATRSRARSATWITCGFKTPRRRGTIARSSACAAARWPARLRRSAREAATKMFADWTTRVAAGEVPPAPPRPEGVERNVVVTLWDIGGRHDVHARRDRDRQEQSHSEWLRARLRRLRRPRQAQRARPGRQRARTRSRSRRARIRARSTRVSRRPRPSNFWGMEHLWGQENPADPHNPMMDRRPRVDHVEDPQRAAGVVPRRLENKYAQYYPLNSSRQARSTIRRRASSS